jgi:hypothetical protein
VVDGAVVVVASVDASVDATVDASLEVLGAATLDVAGGAAALEELDFDPLLPQPASASVTASAAHAAPTGCAKAFFMDPPRATDSTPVHRVW